MIFKRSSGVILHPTSLPGKYGIGELGKEAFDFVDFLVLSGQKLWQTLPLGPTGFGDSPYQCFSAFAGTPLIVSLDRLVEDELLSKSDLEDIPDFNEKCVDYGNVINFKIPLLRQAFKNFENSSNDILKRKYYNFCEMRSSWLNDYALFMALKDYHNGAVWSTWEKDIATRQPAAMEYWKNELSREIQFYQFVQFIFFDQWLELKSYANRNGLKIIGDIPIFVAYDSADVWSNPELFHLDESGYPTVVAGVPPDFFSATGQLWGNPLYNWHAMKKDNYSWWIERFKGMLDLADIIRIDHFRGFAAYWEIPYGEPTAVNGRWVPGPGSDLFYAIEKALGKLPILAEDLGLITPDVIALRDEFNFPGMNILQFAFDDTDVTNKFLPHNYLKNSVVYTGTHDNDTTLSCYQGYPDHVKHWAKKYMHINTSNDSDYENGEICWDFIRTSFASIADIAIIPLQDLLCLGGEARMNFPGKASGNWGWRYTSDQLTKEIAIRLSDLTHTYGR